MPHMDELNGASSSPARLEQSSVPRHEPETSAAPPQISQADEEGPGSAFMPSNLDGATTSPVTQPTVRLPQAAQASPAVNGIVTPAGPSQSRQVNGHQGHGHHVNRNHVNGHNPLLPNTTPEAAEADQTSQQHVDPMEILRHLGFTVVSPASSTIPSTSTSEIEKFRNECPQPYSGSIKLIMAFLLRWEEATSYNVPDLLHIARSVSIIVDESPAWQGPPKYQAMAYRSPHTTPSMIVAGTDCYTVDEALQSLHYFLKKALHGRMTSHLQAHGEHGYVSSDLGI